MNYFYFESKFEIFFFLGGGGAGGRGARINEIFYKESKSEKKNFFWREGGSGGYGGRGVGGRG